MDTDRMWGTMVAEITSRLVGLGWAWAGLAMAAGCLAGSGARGAIAGVLSLLAATTAYYGMDSVLRQEPLTGYWSGMLLWWAASVIVGAALGVVSVGIRRPECSVFSPGRRCRSARPFTIWLTGSPMSGSPAVLTARVIVCVAAAVAVGVVITRFGAAKLGRR